jgi:drug/metabolite transporter (DMT)-like permease
MTLTLEASVGKRKMSDEKQPLTGANATVHAPNDILSILAESLPLVYVSLSGVGFAVQVLILKLLEKTQYTRTFTIISCRGIVQSCMAGFIIYYERGQEDGCIRDSWKLFGDSWKARAILFLRCVLGYGGIGFAFFAVERLPVGDATTLLMLSSIVAAIGGYCLLGESWGVPELVGTCMSLAGVIFITKPSFIFHSAGSKGVVSLDHVGVVFALCSAVCAGLAFVCIRMLGTIAQIPWENTALAQVTNTQ